MKMVTANLLPMVCVILASVLMFSGKDGWGWLVFIAILTSHTVSSNEEEKGE